MTTRPNRLLIFILWAALLVSPAVAQVEPLDPRLTIKATGEEYPSADAVLLLDDIRFDVKTDGTHIFDEHDAVKVLTKSGVDENDVLTRVVNESQAQIEVVQARTIKPNGRVIKAPAPKIDTLASGSKVYEPIKRWSLEFPDVEEGDIVEFHIRTVRKPLPGRHFWATTYVQNPMPIADSTFTATIPTEFKFRYAAPGVPDRNPKDETVTVDGVECRRLSWAISNQQPYNFEALAPSTLSLLNRIEISSFQNWDEVAKFIGDDWQQHNSFSEGLALRVAGWMPPSGSTKERATALLKELTSKRRVAGFLAEFPHFNRPSDVFDEKMISEVDAALLTSASLSAAGIPNLPVLTLGVRADHLDDELPHPEKVQKVALKIPVTEEETYWVDPESSGFLLTAPPLGTAGTAAISWDPRWNSGLQNIRAASAYANREELAMEGRLEANGRAELTVQFDRYGGAALDARQAAREIKEGARGTRDRTLDTYFINTARSYGQRARVLSQFFELDAEAKDPFSLSYTLAVPNFARTEGNKLMVPLPQFLAANIRAAARHKRRSTPLKFEQPYQQDVRIHLLFPEGSLVVDAPETIERRTPEVDFVATGRADGNEVWYVGRLTVREPWVDEDGLERTLEVLSEAIKSEKTVVTVTLAPGQEEPSAEADDPADVEDEGEPG